LEIFREYRYSNVLDDAAHFAKLLELDDGDLNDRNRAADWIIECLSFRIVSAAFVGILYANVEQSGLRGGMFAQFSHFIHLDIRRFLLLSLCPALSLFPRFLLACLFFLSLIKS
jgi:hypothetical protein